MIQLMVDAGRNPDWVWDELILCCDLLARNNWVPLDTSRKEVAELSQFMKSLPLHPTGPVERTVNSIRFKMSNLKSHHPEFNQKPTNSSRLDRRIVERFIEAPDEMREEAAAIRVQGAAGEFDGLPPQTETELAEVSAAEGGLFVRRHLARERDRRLKGRKIKSVLGGGASIACQVCGFDFEATYGSRGAGYIECHHVIPLAASGKTRTSLDQLALICANCHRMIHRADPWLTPDELKSLLVR